MKYLKLSKAEKDYVKKIPVLNDKRNWLQNTVVRSSLENTKSKKYIWSLHPRAGKNYTCLKLINLYDKKYSNPLKMHLMICPTIHIKEEFDKLMHSEGIFNTVSVTCSGAFSKSFVSKFSNYEWGIIFYDEADFGVSSDKSIKWSEVLNFKSSHKVCLSGTFDDSNVTYLEQNGFDTLFEITIEDGGYMETLPTFTTYNYGVDLSHSEQLEYSRIHDYMETLIAPYRRLFTEGNWAEYAISMIGGGKHLIKINGVTKTSNHWLEMISEHTGWNYGVILGRKKRYLEHRALLNNILENSEGKINAINEIVNSTEDKGIIFTSRKETCDLIANQNNNVVSYHSGTDNSKEVLKEFNTGNKKAIISVNKISRGFTNSGIGYAINSSYNSTSNGYIQKISRALSLDEKNKNKEAKIINLYCKNFIINNKEYITRDYLRLMKAQKGASVEWCDDVLSLND